MRLPCKSLQFTGSIAQTQLESTMDMPSQLALPVVGFKRAETQTPARETPAAVIPHVSHNSHTWFGDRWARFLTKDTASIRQNVSNSCQTRFDLVVWNHIHKFYQLIRALWWEFNFHPVERKQFWLGYLLADNPLWNTRPGTYIKWTLKYWSNGNQIQPLPGDCISRYRHYSTLILAKIAIINQTQQVSRSTLSMLEAQPTCVLTCTSVDKYTFVDDKCCFHIHVDSSSDFRNVVLKLAVHDDGAHANQGSYVNSTCKVITGSL